MAEIRWFGHNCFRIKAKEATVMLDPLSKATGYALPRQTADIVTISHGHEGHANTAAIKPPFKVVNGPGEYEMSGVFIHGVRTWHDNAAGAESGTNTAYMIDVEGIKFCHLGDLGHPLSPAQMERLESCDVVMVPAGGGSVLSPEQAAEVISQLDPKLVLPMQFRSGSGDSGLEDATALCKLLGKEIGEPVEKLNVKHSDLEDEMRVVLLSPEGDTSK